MSARPIRARCRRCLQAAAPAACVLAVATVAAASPRPPTISLSQSQVTLGGAVTVSGLAPPGAALTLEADAWPFHGFAPLANAVTGAAGSYVFAPLRPDRNMLLRVTLAGASAGASPAVALTVYPRVRLLARSLGPGRTMLALGVRHVRTAGGAPPVVRWFAAAPGSRAYHLIAVSGSGELPGGLLRAQVVIDPPARRFMFRVCLNPAWEAAMGTAAERGGCPRRGFVLPATGETAP